MTDVLGIDLGTTKTAMAIIDEMGRPTLVKNSEGDDLLSSAVLFKDDKTIVGDRAKRGGATQAENLALFSKRHMCDEEWVFPDGRGEEHRPEEISGIILRRLKQDAKQALGRDIEKAVITVPAYFQDMERNRTKTAGEVAGFEVLRLINEPTAAAVAYGLDQLGEEMNVLVYDLGGGTFDVTIMKVSGSKISAIATGGDRFLGGADFDKLIVDRIKEKFEEANGFDPTDELRVLRETMNEAEKAKHMLSTDTETLITVTAQGQSLDYELTREEFNTLIEHLISQTERITEETLDEANMEWADIDRMLLVGGSTRIPYVQERLKQLSGKDPELGIDPDEVVAQGAAIIAAQEAGTTVRDSEGDVATYAEIADITGHALGVKSWSVDEEKYRNTTIIPKGTEVPAKNTHPFTTIDDNQTSVRFTMLEGESEDPDECEVIGDDDRCVLRGIPPRPQGVPKIDVTMKYDKEGIVRLHAIEAESGEEITADIERPELLTQQEQEELHEAITQREIA